MAKPQAEARAQPPAGYFAWSRDPAVGLFAVMPLWLLYEGLRLLLTPNERNGAESLMAETLHMLGPAAPDVLRLLMLVVVLLAAWSIRRRQVPWARVALVAALEGTFYGLLLGPLASVMAESTRLMLVPSGRLVADLVGSLGAGLFEEAVFRLFLLSLLGLLFMRLCQTFACPRVVGVVAAVVASAALFSWFHHVGPGAQPFAPGVFVFRAMAGLLLGTLFVLRGFGVCVYTHVMYDVHYYLTHR